jgi:hypothetical protein
MKVNHAATLELSDRQGSIIKFYVVEETGRVTMKDVDEVYGQNLKFSDGVNLDQAIEFIKKEILDSIKEEAINEEEAAGFDKAYKDFFTVRRH